MIASAVFSFLLSSEHTLSLGSWKQNKDMSSSTVTMREVLAAGCSSRTEKTVCIFYSGFCHRWQCWLISSILKSPCQPSHQPVPRCWTQTDQLRIPAISWIKSPINFPFPQQLAAMFDLDSITLFFHKHFNLRQSLLPDILISTTFLSAAIKNAKRKQSPFCKYKTTLGNCPHSKKNTANRWDSGSTEN